MINIEGDHVEIIHSKANGEIISKQVVHNILYEEGKNFTRQALFLGGIGNATNISLCNATEGCGIPVADLSEEWNVLVGIGADSVEGTYALLSGTSGNFSIYNTFTFSDTASINASRLGNASGTNLSGFNFTIVNAEATDQLTINYTGYIS